MAENGALHKNRFGLTGSMGSGKSTVAEMLKSFGAVVLDADRVSREVLAKDGCCYEEVAAHFGSGILLPDGSVNRKKLAEVIFADEGERLFLNGVVHAAVHRTLWEEAEKLPEDRVIVFDVPLLFESGWSVEMYKTAVVVCEDEIRLQRICDRDGCTKEQAAARLRAQMPQEEKIARADFVVENSGTLEALEEAVKRLYGRMEELIR